MILPELIRRPSPREGYFFRMTLGQLRGLARHVKRQGKKASNDALQVQTHGSQKGCPLYTLNCCNPACSAKTPKKAASTFSIQKIVMIPGFIISSKEA